MASLLQHHKELDAEGRGKCSVPAWRNGLPAGFCDAEAYGTRPKCREFRDAYTGKIFREDGKYDGYVPALACPNHGGPKTRVFKDGDKWCAVYSNFVNLQESAAGFGITTEDARKELEKIALT